MLNLPELDALNKPYRIYADYVEQGAITQFLDFMRQDWVMRGALMPDVHTGYSLPIGAVIECKDKVSPAAVGYDQGCGMLALKTSFLKSDVAANAAGIFEGIYAAIPTGFKHNTSNDSSWDGSTIARTSVVDAILDAGGLKQLGTLGSGNHFIEIGYDSSDAVWITIHSGSRNVGHTVASHYMDLASGGASNKEGCYSLSTDTEEGKDYITDLNFCLQFALANRLEMASRVVRVMAGFAKGDADMSCVINRNHNHAELKNGMWVHRKGATHAEEGMLGAIPGNMRDGVFIVKGKGNPDSLCSSSHGAGRVMGRNQAKKNLSLDTFKADMLAKGITAKVGESTLDESAGAYKNIWEVMALQSDLVEVLHHITPLINIKA